MIQKVSLNIAKVKSCRRVGEGENPHYKYLDERKPRHTAKLYASKEQCLIYG